MRTPVALVAVVLMTWVVATGCGSGSGTSSSGGGTGSGGSTVEYDQELGETIVAMSKRGETRRLADLTDFTWDEVYLYSEGASADMIAKEVGAEVLSEEYYYSAGNLLVFTRDGEVEHAISVVPDLLTWDGKNVFGSAAELTPAHPGAKSGLLRVQQPGA